MRGTLHPLHCVFSAAFSITDREKNVEMTEKKDRRKKREERRKKSKEGKMNKKLKTIGNNLFLFG